MQENIFSPNELQTLFHLPEVAEAKANLSVRDTVSFRVTHPEISKRLAECNLPAPTEIPMRWIKGDTEEHVDVGGHFTKTSLVYLNGSGDFVIGADTFSIQENRAFTFDEGVKHHTENASTRLLLGPMNERGEEVGGAGPEFRPYNHLSLTRIGLQGDFLNWFSATNAEQALSYSSFLETYSQFGAFAQNFHTVQFRQFDGALNNFRNDLANLVPFSLTSEYTAFLRNTTFMLQNINERINLINFGVRSIFGNADVFSETTLSGAYLSETAWPQGETWNYLPSLIEPTSDFITNTYDDDANHVNPPS